jgi:lactate permease
MFAPQSLVVASTDTGIYGDEGGILRRVLIHSVLFASLIGTTVLAILHSPKLLRILIS